MNKNETVQQPLRSGDLLGGKTALIRQCDVCGMTTAIDLDPTPENFKTMQFFGQYVREVSREKAMELWKKAGKCKCNGTLAA
jgi:hypothetical protein